MPRSASPSQTVAQATENRATVSPVQEAIICARRDDQAGIIAHALEATLKEIHKSASVANCVNERMWVRQPFGQCYRVVGGSRRLFKVSGMPKGPA